MSRPQPIRPEDEQTQAMDLSAAREDDVATKSVDLTLAEERLVTGTETVRTGSVRARKEIDVERVEQVVPRGVEHADLERVTVLEGDSGQVETLPDGSLSIPVFEEQIVVEKRLVVRERIIVRKHTVVEDHVVEATLRKERVEVDVDDEVAGRVEVDPSLRDPSLRDATP